MTHIIKVPCASLDEIRATKKFCAETSGVEYSRFYRNTNGTWTVVVLSVNAVIIGFNNIFDADPEWEQELLADYSASRGV